MDDNKHYVYFLKTNDGSYGIHHTAFHNKDEAIARLKSLPICQFYYLSRTSAIERTATTAFYATLSHSKTMHGKRENSDRSGLYPTIDSLKENYIFTDCCLEDDEIEIVHKTKRENTILIQMNDGFYYYKIKSVKII